MRWCVVNGKVVVVVVVVFIVVVVCGCVWWCVFTPHTRTLDVVVHNQVRPSTLRHNTFVRGKFFVVFRRRRRRRRRVTSTRTPLLTRRIWGRVRVFRVARLHGNGVTVVVMVTASLL